MCYTSSIQPFRENHMTVFLFGDNQFLWHVWCFWLVNCKLQHLHLPTSLMNVGHHCCLWCVVSATEMQMSRSQHGLKELRYLDHLKAAYGSFQKTGNNPKKAMECFNVISPHLFNIPLNEVFKQGCMEITKLLMLIQLLH